MNWIILAQDEKSRVTAVNLLKTKRNLLYIRISPYRAVNTFHHCYKNQ